MGCIVFHWIYRTRWKRWVVIEHYFLSIHRQCHRLFTNMTFWVYMISFELCLCLCLSSNPLITSLIYSSHFFFETQQNSGQLYPRKNHAFETRQTQYDGSCGQGSHVHSEITSRWSWRSGHFVGESPLDGEELFAWQWCVLSPSFAIIISFSLTIIPSFSLDSLYSFIVSTTPF